MANFDEIVHGTSGMVNPRHNAYLQVLFLGPYWPQNKSKTSTPNHKDGQLGGNLRYLPLSWNHVLKMNVTKWNVFDTRCRQPIDLTKSHPNLNVNWPPVTRAVFRIISHIPNFFALFMINCIFPHYLAFSAYNRIFPRLLHCLNTLCF